MVGDLRANKRPLLDTLLADETPPAAECAAQKSHSWHLQNLQWLRRPLLQNVAQVRYLTSPVMTEWQGSCPANAAAGTSPSSNTTSIGDSRSSCAILKL